MWFKNIQVYKLNSKDRFNEDDIETKLNKFRFTPCGEYDLLKTGWVTILDNDKEDKLTRKIDEAFFFQLRTEKKIIPSAVVKERLQEKVQEHIIKNDKRPSKEEKNDYKDAIILNMAKNAFSSSTYLNGYIDYKSNYLIVNTGSSKQAEEFIGSLRMAFESLEVSPLEPEDDPSIKMSGWVANKSIPDVFSIGHGCDLKDTDGGSITVKKHEIETDEVIQHLDNGKSVTKLELTWQKRVTFNLTNKFEIKGIKFEDIVKESIKDNLGDSDDAYSVFQENMYIMVGDFAEIIDDLLEAV